MDLLQWWTTFASRGLFYIPQADYQPWADGTDALFTQIRVGAWCASGDVEATNGAGTHSVDFGLYTTLDQMLLTEADDSGQGQGGFLQFSWPPPDRNQVDLNYKWRTPLPRTHSGP